MCCPLPIRCVALRVHGDQEPRLRQQPRCIPLEDERNAQQDRHQEASPPVGRGRRERSRAHPSLADRGAQRRRSASAPAPAARPASSATPRKTRSGIAPRAARAGTTWAFRAAAGRPRTPTSVPAAAPHRAIGSGFGCAGSDGTRRARSTLPWMAPTADLSVDLAPRAKRELILRNPVMTASGTFSNGLEFARILDYSRLGAIVSKGRHAQAAPRQPQPALRRDARGDAQQHRLPEHRRLAPVA